MKYIIKYFFYLLLFVIPNIFGITLSATELSVVDSTKVEVRQPDPKFLDTYRTQKEFAYLAEPPVQTNFFKRLFQYIKNLFASLERYSDIIPWLFKLMLWILVLVFLFVIITKTKIYKLFYTETEIENPDYVFSNPDDQIIDFDEVIHSEITRQQYRQAIRLLYLKLINILRINNHIHYSKEKTNRDYINELPNDDLKFRFSTITSIYNYVWYGDVEIGKDQFLRFEESFQSIYCAINDQK